MPKSASCRENNCGHCEIVYVIRDGNYVETGICDCDCHVEDESE